ncbi:uncharacterized protein LOC105195289 [Solenopsis invicta]|uniref:uncharacterized protein LOC105195289 n=1 Tax=Solenopsis invicta TaxID=13686 RepID=UPI00193E3289|nr:uncharacterized protein LOC105195289 [Solenopsis invicta]
MSAKIKKNAQNQVEDISSSIEHILRPITYTSWLLGVGVARPRKCPIATTIIIRILHLAACTVYVVYGVKTLINSGNVFADSVILKFTHLMNIVTFYVSTYYNICHGIRFYNKWPELMDKIKELDQKIERETPINNRPIIILEALAFLMTIAWCPLYLTVHVLYYYFINPKDICVSDILFYYMMAQFLIANFVFNIVVYVLCYRFKTINNLIRQLNELSDASQMVSKIKRIRELHIGICHLVSMINDIHGRHLIFCSANSFAMVVSSLFLTYTSIMKENYSYFLVDNIIWIEYTIQFGLMCWICTLTHQESDKIGESICEIVLTCELMNPDKMNETSNQANLECPPFEDPDSKQNSSSSNNLNYVVLENLLRKNLDRDCIRNEMNDFRIQLQQYQVAFTACDFFEMNNALFAGFIGIVISYLTVFIEFYDHPESMDKNATMKLF